jgi:hypothetical protein
LVEEFLTLEELEKLRQLLNDGDNTEANAAIDRMINDRLEHIRVLEQEIDDMYDNVPV